MIVEYDVDFDKKVEIVAEALILLGVMPSLTKERAIELARMALLQKKSNEVKNVLSQVAASPVELFDGAYAEYKKWPNNGGPNWSGNSPNPWEAFFAGYKAALNK